MTANDPRALAHELTMLVSHAETKVWVSVVAHEGVGRGVSLRVWEGFSSVRNIVISAMSEKIG